MRTADVPAGPYQTRIPGFNSESPKRLHRHNLFMRYIVTGIFHQAAIPSVPRSVKDPLASNEANVTSTL